MAKIDISPMLLQTGQQVTGACVPARTHISFEMLQKLEKYDYMFEPTTEFSGTENTVYRASFLQDEFVNCKFCQHRKPYGDDNPCTICSEHDNFLQLKSGKFVGAYFVPDAIEFQLWRIKNGENGERREMK